jgi:hypothetical protein
MTAGYCVADLLAPVKEKINCHYVSLPHELLGFIYFLIFEYVFHRRIYKGAVGRTNLCQFNDPLEFFVSVAYSEYEDLFGRNEDMTETDIKLRNDYSIKFYK